MPVRLEVYKPENQKWAEEGPDIQSGSGYRTFVNYANFRHLSVIVVGCNTAETHAVVRTVVVSDFVRPGEDLGYAEYHDSPRNVKQVLRSKGRVSRPINARLAPERPRELIRFKFV